MHFSKATRPRKPSPTPLLARGAIRQLKLEPLEDRRMLAFTVNHTPYLKLGDAPLTGYGSGLDQAEVLWQTTGTQDTDTFTAQVRETGTVPWTNASLIGDINTGVDDGAGLRSNHVATFTALNFDDNHDYLNKHKAHSNPIATPLKATDGF